VAAPAGAATLYACVKKDGTAHLFGGKHKCHKGEHRLSWNLKGLAGANGSPGVNGLTGTPGASGKAGAPGVNGAVAGFSKVLSGGNVILTGSESSTPVTVLSLSLPAGSYILSAHVTLEFIESQAGGEAADECSLIDTPTGGGATVEDSEFYVAPINFAFIEFVALSNLPLQLAVSSPSAPSTVSIQCFVELQITPKGSTFKAEADTASIDAVQTSSNS